MYPNKTRTAGRRPRGWGPDLYVTNIPRLAPRRGVGSWARGSIQGEVPYDLRRLRPRPVEDVVVPERDVAGRVDQVELRGVVAAPLLAQRVLHGQVPCRIREGEARAGHIVHRDMGPGVGNPVGSVGPGVGSIVGAGTGTCVATMQKHWHEVGAAVGTGVGTTVGGRVGSRVGASDGAGVGAVVGAWMHRKPASATPRYSSLVPLAK